MELKFKVSGIIARPVHEVFEAVADPEKLSGYFTTGGARGRLEKGATVTWDFADFPGAFPVQVIDVVEDEKIVLEWAAADGSSAVETGKHPGSVGYNTVVTMSFAPADGNRTLVSIAEEGWRETETGLAASYGNCMGWSQMIAALKVYLEHGINLREGFYK